jgi:hypothetical protein
MNADMTLPRILLLATLAAAAAAQSAHAAPPADWTPAVGAARAFALQRDGLVSFHVRTLRGVAARLLRDLP